MVSGLSILDVCIDELILSGRNFLLNLPTVALSCFKFLKINLLVLYIFLLYRVKQNFGEAKILVCYMVGRLVPSQVLTRVGEAFNKLYIYIYIYIH